MRVFPKPESHPTALTTAALLLVLLAGCGSRNTVDEAAAPAASTGPWFCEPKLDGAGWDCTDDPGRVANPRPSQPLARVLANREAAAEADTAGSLEVLNDNVVTAPSTLTSSATTDTAPDPAAAGAVPTEAAAEDDVEPSGQSDAVTTAVEGAASIGTVAPTDRESAAADDPADEPAYARLAYRPEQPVSLLDLPPDFYAVQIIAFSSAAELKRFFDRLGVNELTAAEVEVDGALRYVLLLGVYETFAAAEAAAANPPAELEAYDPWIRRLGGLQAAMLRADRRRQ